MLAHQETLLNIYESLNDSSEFLTISEATAFIRSFFSSYKNENEWLVNDYYSMDQCVNSKEMSACEENRATACCFAGACETTLEEAARNLTFAGYEREAENLCDTIGRIYVAEDLLLDNARDLFGYWTEMTISLYLIFILNHERRHSHQSWEFINENRIQNAVNSLSIEDYNAIPSELDANNAGLEAVREYFNVL